MELVSRENSEVTEPSQNVFKKRKDLRTRNRGSLVTVSRCVTPKGRLGTVLGASSIPNDVSKSVRVSPALAG